MSRNLERLYRGERWWAAEIAFRASGALLLAVCYRTAVLAQALVCSRPPHQTMPGEFLVCAAVFLTLTSGLALVLAGPALLRRVPIPPHSAYFPNR